MSKLDPQKQRDFPVEVVRQLRETCFEAYWAGGLVRDYLLGAHERLRRGHKCPSGTNPRCFSKSQNASHWRGRLA